MTNAFDAYLRRTNVSSASGATVLTTNGYTFDLAGRLSTARDGTFLATYSYLANSPLVSQIEFKSNTTVRLTTTKTYDQLNRLTSIASVGTGSTPSVTSYSYSYNDANQRTRVNLADGSFWIYPVRYGLKILLRLRPAVTKGRPLLHRLHPRFATTPSLASKWRGRVHTGPPAGRIDLLRGVSASAGRHSAGEIFEVSLGQTLSEKPPAKLSHGVNEYDSLGQVKSGKRYWIDWTPVAGQQFEYGFDDTRPVRGGNSRHLRRMEMDAIAVDGDARSNISHGVNNRNSTKSGGDAAGASLRLASYTNNSLNQITGRDVPAYLNVIGVATATATNVNVNNTLAYRKGEYYRVELNPNNTSAAVWQSVTNRAVQSGTTNSTTGNLFLPKTAEVFAYDADGSPHEIALQDFDLGVTTDLAQSKHPVSRLSHGEILTNDGRWAYVWDGENRLVRQFAPTTAPSGSVVALVFGYDWQGRRISKTVSNWTGSAWNKILDEKYLYDGWNQLASLNASNTTVVRAFLWGSDLSGSLQGAGGVGGLLAINAKGVGVAFTAFDGNGNVMALVNAAGGDALAKYEYGPFGEVIRASGTLAKPNPFRFSTKFQDDETDQLYYGYRYLSPSTGRWLNRDPIGEEGGLNLSAALNNNLIDLVDPLGLMTSGEPVGSMTSGELDQMVRALDRIVRLIRCCSRRSQLTVSLSGVANGSSVTMTLTPKTSGKGWVKIVGFYWWDCFQSQKDAVKAGVLIQPPDQNWQQYGFYTGSSSVTKTHTGSAPMFYDPVDNRHWNWTGGVIYLYCGRDGFLHATTLDAIPQQQFTWPRFGSGWKGPVNPWKK